MSIYNIKALIFDLDGVIVETKDLHYKALNEAISFHDKKYIIKYEEHLSQYDGLSTREKLNILVQKGLNKNFVDQISSDKQKITESLLNLGFNANNPLFNLLD